MKFKNKFENYCEHAGTTTTGESLTDQSQAAEADIYKCIEKYGVTTLMRQSMAKEHMYLDNTATMGLSPDDVLRQKEQMAEYFDTMPARARKVFGDNIDVFQEKYRNGEFDDFINTGALSKEQVDLLQADIKERKSIERNAIINSAKDAIIAEAKDSIIQNYIKEQEALKNVPEPRLETNNNNNI